jgi:uncharacterized protein (TIGR02266 family)
MADQQAGNDEAGAERRTSLRVPAEIWVEETRAGEVYFQRTVNLSEGGLFFERTIPHPKGTIVNLKFSLPESEKVIQCKGEIVNLPKNTEGLGMGIKFVDLSDEHRAEIVSFVRLFDGQREGEK